MSNPFSSISNHFQCEDFTSTCQADTTDGGYRDYNKLSPICKGAESSCCGVADHNFEVVTNVEWNSNETVDLYDECKCDFWLRLCGDLKGGKACDYASEYCCGDYLHWREGAFTYTNSPMCYCDFFNYAQNELGYKLKSQALQVNKEFQDPCGQLEAFYTYQIFPDPRGWYERLSLEAIYNRTNGRNWINNAGWMDDAIDHCQWYGITCDGEGFVTNIDLRDNNLAGQFPVYSRREIDEGGHQLKSHWRYTKHGLANLWNLKTLDLANNKLTGTIEYRPLYNLVSLTHFDVSGNQLKGKVDALVTPSLTYVDLSNNNFTSIHGFEKYKGSFQTLHFCDLSNNRIQIDATELLEYTPPNIEQFLASNNGIYGYLPESLNNLPKLRQFDMSSNALSGSLPGFTESMVNLQELELSNQTNGLTGSIPEDLGKLQSLKILNLAGNKLEGDIPSSIGNMAVLEVLDLSINLLQSSIPPELGLLEGESLAYYILKLYNESVERANTSTFTLVL